MSRKGVVSSICSLTLLCVMALSGAPAHSVGRRLLLSPEKRSQQRIRPPGSLGCSRNDLTSFTGRVLSYTRGTKRLSIRMRTDEQTNERFVLRYGATEDPAQWFLLRAEPFKVDDWRMIESSPRRLRPGMRATVWVCSNGQQQQQPIIDWQPPER